MDYPYYNSTFVPTFTAEELEAYQPIMASMPANEEAGGLTLANGWSVAEPGPMAHTQAGFMAAATHGKDREPPLLQFASDAWFPESVAPATPYQNQVPFTPYQNQVPFNPYQNQVLATQYQHQATQYQNQVGDYAQQVYASQYWQQPPVQSMFAGPSNLDGPSYTFANSLAPEAPAALPPSTSSKHRFRSPTS